MDTQLRHFTPACILTHSLTHLGSWVVLSVLCTLSPTPSRPSTLRSMISMSFDILLTESFIHWFYLVPTIYFVINAILRWGNRWPKTVEGTRGADIVAYELTSCFVCLFVGLAGSYAWLNMCTSCNFDSIENDRIYGRSEYFEKYLAAPLLSYQFWNFVICLVIDEMRDVLLLVHHVASGLCALFSVHPFLQYYGLFFFGVPEITSVPLTFVSLTKSFPSLKTDYPIMYEMNKWTFGILFLVIRLAMWTYVSVFYWIDTVHLLTAVDAPEPHSMFVVGYYCFANVVLTGMQYFWGFKIIAQVTGEELPSEEAIKKKKK